LSDLLFLSQRIPYPPNKGDKIRSFYILRHLAQRHRVHLGCFVDDPEDWQHVEALKEFCVDTHIARLDPRKAKIRSVAGLFNGEPLNLPYYRDPGFARWVNTVLHGVRPAAMFVFSSNVAQYAIGPNQRRPRFVMDFVDVDSDKWRQYAETKSWPLNWVYRRESQTLLTYDRRMAELADASIFVSDAEAALFRSLAPESAGKVHAVENGIDSGFFAPGTNYPNPTEAAHRTLVFTGAMDYWPNIDAVTWFAEEIFPLVRERHPEVTFFIVGSNPSADVSKLGARPGIHVTGRVADVRPYLAHATAAVVPMRIARRIQNKVLEAMAMGRPVVTTPEGFEGIKAIPGTELLVAADSRAFAEATVRAVEDPSVATMGSAARQRVLDDFSWPAKLEAIDRLIAG